MADLTGFVEGTDGKGDDLSRHGGDLRFCPDFQSYRRRGDVFNIQRGADGGLAFLQRFRHGVAGCALHQRDHAGGGVDQQIAGADLLGGVLPLTERFGHALHANGNSHRYHDLSVI